MREYAECEFTTAGPTTPFHLRKAGGSLNTAGGQIETLCGLFGLGWDVRDVTTHEMAATVRAIQPGAPGAICARCADSAVPSRHHGVHDQTRPDAD